MCDHLEFDGAFNVHRLEDTQDGESLRVMIDLQVACAACQTPVRFALPLGVNMVQGAKMSLDGTEARLTAAIGIPKAPRVLGFGVRGPVRGPEGEDIV